MNLGTNPVTMIQVLMHMSQQCHLLFTLAAHWTSTCHTVVKSQGSQS